MQCIGTKRCLISGSSSSKRDTFNAVHSSFERWQNHLKVGLLHEFCRHTLHNFPYRLWTIGIKFSLTVETTVFNSQQLFPSCLLIYIIYSLPVLPITFAVTVFSVLWLFQSHAAVVKRYNAFCIKLTANNDTKQNSISKSTFPVCVSEHFHI